MKVDTTPENTSSTSSKGLDGQVRRTLLILFVTLLIDLLSFTLILPLFPTMLNHYYLSSPSNSLLSQLFSFLSTLRSSPITNNLFQSMNLETTLLGGILGSLYSLLQFLVSPYIGKLADRYGRRKLLLTSIFFNLVSSLIWVFASNFYLFLLSRVVAGLSEGNVQLATTIISDVTPKVSRNRYMALVGIAFGIAFTFGPAMGGYLVGIEWFTRYNYYHPYVTASLLSTLLLVVEYVLVYLYLPETKLTQATTDSLKAKSRLDQVNHLKPVTFLFLFIFSGLEFTLPFLTFALYDFTPIDQGKLFAKVGILSVLFQSILVRRFGDRIGSHNLVQLGLLSCLVSLVLMSGLASFPSLDYGVNLLVFNLALTSATVVNGLNSLASTLLQSKTNGVDGELSPTLAEDLGTFRSYGQLGRCGGPIAISTLYWYLGPTLCFITCSGITLILFLWFHNLKFKSKIE